MAKRYKQGRNKKNNKKRIVLQNIIICGVSLFLLTSTFVSCYRIYTLQNKVEAVTQELEDKKKEKETLSKTVKNLQEPEYVVKYARDNYAYIREGEIVVEIPSRENNK